MMGPFFFQVSAIRVELFFLDLNLYSAARTQRIMLRRVK